MNYSVLRDALSLVETHLLVRSKVPPVAAAAAVAGAWTQNGGRT